MRWLLLPFRFCLYFPFYAMFEFLQQLTHDYDRFVKLGARLFFIFLGILLFASMLGVRLTVDFSGTLPFGWWLVILISLWCGTGWLLSRKPLQRLFSGIANYCKKAILPPAPQPKAKPVKAVPKSAPPKQPITVIASKGVAGANSSSVEQSIMQLSPEMINLMTQNQPRP